MKVSKNKIFSFTYNQVIDNEITYGERFHVLAKNFDHAKILADNYASQNLQNPLLKECAQISIRVITDGEDKDV